MPFDAAAPAEVSARDRMIQLRDFLAELPDEKFDISLWHCGTAGCIGGWAETLFFGSAYSGHDESEVGEHIGLSVANAERLFYPLGYRYGRHTPAQAVAVLDHYLATGEISWAV